jgi:membrane-bound serine protease (ClpP class)
VRRLLALSMLLTLGAAGPVATQEVTVVLIPVSGTIENGLAPFVARSLREAAARSASAAILDINTPGGRIDAAERIVDAVRNSPIPVYAFVNPRAFSAGAMIALSARGIYMRPGAVMGAATPVDGGGQKGSEKIVSAMRSEFRALAEQHGLDPRIAEGMVDETIDIPGVKPTGQLLTLSTGEALELGFAKAEVASLQALLGELGLADATVMEVQPNWAELVVRFLTNPLVSPLLLSLGMLGLVFEIKAGAFGLGGLLSLTALGLFFGSSMLLGLAGWEEVLLLGLGLIALGVEVFVLPGFGVAGVIGILLIAASMLLALVGSLPSATDFIQAGAILGVSLVITTAVIFGWLRHLPSSQRWSGLFLRDSTTAAEGFISAPSRGDLVGREGKASTDLRPAGTATFEAERLDVVTEGEFVKAGTIVRVIRSDGYRHVVRAIDA